MRNDRFQSRERENVAYYHLPGLFEFYELYEAFLPIYREHREYFYDWCGIGSIYGAPADCIWGGGRIGSGEHGVQEVMNLMSEYGISARLTFSNSLLREEHLADEKCNALCKALNDSEGISNGVIVHSDILARYIKKHYPNLYLVSSTTKVLTDFNDFLNEVKREDFQYVVPDFRPVQIMYALHLIHRVDTAFLRQWRIRHLSVLVISGIHICRWDFPILRLKGEDLEAHWCWNSYCIT